jgi:hypothetical protein
MDSGRPEGGKDFVGSDWKIMLEEPERGELSREPP